MLPRLQEEWPLLIIVPASLRLVWAEELERWLPHLRPSHIHVIEGRTDRCGAFGMHSCWLVDTVLAAAAPRRPSL